MENTAEHSVKAIDGLKQRLGEERYTERRDNSFLGVKI